MAIWALRYLKNAPQQGDLLDGHTVATNGTDDLTLDDGDAG